MKVFYVNSTAGRWRILGSLLFLLLLALLPFFWGYMKTVFASSRDDQHGTWVGPVTLSTLKENEFGQVAESGTEHAVLMLSIHPVVFSYLTRDKVAAELTDAQGRKLTFDVESLRDDWRVPWSGSQDQLVAASPVDTLVGVWNGSMSPFQLLVKPRFPYPRTHLLSDHVNFRISGTLERSDAAAYNRLITEMQKSSPQH